MSKEIKTGTKNLVKEIKIKIDGKEIKAQEGEILLEVAKKNGIDIPALCYHPDLKIKANCRMCLVEIKGQKGLQTSCSVPVSEGMEVITNSSEIKKSRKINLELIFSQHREECFDCVWKHNCQLLKLAREYDVAITRFKDRKSRFPIEIAGPIEFDWTKCMDCKNCVEMCQKQGVGFLEIEKKDDFFQVTTSKREDVDCVYCGQCIVHCPVGAIETTGEFEAIKEPLKKKNKLLIAQIAPSVRTSIGEEFGIEYGTSITEKLAAALRKLGFDRVFDVCLGSDFTTVEEAKEFIKRLEGKGPLPLMTSCCPAWVKFVEFYYPEFIPNLTTVRSPHIILGGLVKTYFADKEKINPKDIFVVSIMPCTAKKYEIKREELKIDDLYTVDYVLTTRELVYLLKENKIDLKKIEPEELDNPLGFASGAGVIYGASGGVMESALRTASFDIVGENLKKVEFYEARGMKGVKRAEVKIGEKRLRIAIVNLLGNAKKVLEELKREPELYHYIEVMACPGGCVGGGGQPLPVSQEIRKKRAGGLYKVDKENKIRLAHENPIINEVYNSYLTPEKEIHRILHTHYIKKQREN